MGRVSLIALWLLAFALPARGDATQLAAVELKRYLGEPSSRIDVIIDASVGGGSESFSIASEGERIKIAGSNAHMALCGAYHLLDMAGYRFLAPNFAFYDGGAEIAPTKKLDLKIDAPIVKKPALKFRKFYVEEGHSHDLENLKQLAEWMPKAGYNTLVIPTDYQGSGRVKWDNWRKELTPELQKRGITIEVGGHGYQNFLNAEMEEGKLFDQHPQWFGKNNEGKPQRAKGRVICTSNSAAVDYLINNFTAYIKERPEIQIYDFWPPDGAKWCECDACVKLGTPSDRQAILVHQVKERVAPVRPDLRLEVLAYHTSVMPPENQKLEKGILLDFCPIAQQFDHQINDASAEKNAEYVKGVTAWRKAFDGDISIYTYYRKYAWDSLPVIIPRYMQKDLQWYTTLPTQGVSVYSEPADWGTYELNHYVLAKLAWDANADVEVLIKTFCDARYASEAEVARDVLMMMQRITRVYSSIPHTSLKSEVEIKQASADADAVRLNLLVALNRSKDNPPVQLALKRLSLMCSYLISDLQIQHMRASKAPIEKIREKATNLHAWVKEHANDGVFLIKNQRLSLNRMLTRYGVGEKKPAPAAAPE